MLVPASQIFRKNVLDFSVILTIVKANFSYFKGENIAEKIFCFVFYLSVKRNQLDLKLRPKLFISYPIGDQHFLKCQI